MTRFIILLLITLGLAACGVPEDCGDESPCSSDHSTHAEDGKVIIPVDIYQAQPTGLGLLPLTGYEILIDGCSSGYRQLIDPKKSTIHLPEGDSGCLVKPTSVSIQQTKFTPQPSKGFSTWQKHDRATFTHSSNPKETLSIMILSTISNPIKATDVIRIQIKSSSPAAGSAGKQKKLAIEGHLAPALHLRSMALVGSTAGGGGVFQFTMECKKTVTDSGLNGRCIGTRWKDLRYRLVSDVYNDHLTRADAEKLFPTDEQAIDKDLTIAPGFAGLANGGFKTSPINGPERMADHPEMILVFEAGDQSYLYFNVNLKTISQK